MRRFELHRDAGGNIWAIRFDGVVYLPVRRVPRGGIVAGPGGADVPVRIDTAHEHLLTAAQATARAKAALQDINRQQSCVGLLHDQPEPAHGGHEPTLRQRLFGRKRR